MGQKVKIFLSKSIFSWGLFCLSLIQDSLFQLLQDSSRQQRELTFLLYSATFLTS